MGCETSEGASFLEERSKSLSGDLLRYGGRGRGCGVGCRLRLRWRGVCWVGGGTLREGIC